MRSLVPSYKFVYILDSAEPSIERNKDNGWYLLCLYSDILTIS